MKRNLSIVALVLMVLLTASLVVQASPIALRQGYWKIDAGGGRILFEDGVMHVKDYAAWTLIQYGANTDAGQFSLLGSTGVQVEIKVEEDTDFELAIQLADWAWQPVEKVPVEAGDWVVLDFDLSGYNLSAINALCFQSGGADFSIRSVTPTPIAGEGGAVQTVSNVTIGGEAKLNVTASKVEIIEDNPLAFNEENWTVDGTGEAEFGDNSVVLSGWSGWGTHFVWNGDFDFSGYIGVKFEYKLENWSDFHFLLEPGYVKVYDENLGPVGWVAVEIYFEDLGLSEDDVAKIEGLKFQLGGIDWAVRNIAPIAATESGPVYETVLERDYSVALNLAYTINDDWVANVNTTLSEQALRVGLAEVRGTPGDLNVRIFANGTGANLGDPMQAVRGDKYNKDKTAGFDLRGPLGDGAGHVFVSTPVKPDPGHSYFAGGSYKLHLDDGTEVQVLAATEFIDDPDKKNPFILGAAASHNLDFGLGLTGQAVFSGGSKGIGFYGKAVWKKLEGGITYAPEELWTARGDYAAQDGYRLIYVQGNADITESVSGGFYVNQYYNLKKEDSQYKTRLVKLNADWTIADGYKFGAAFEQEKQVNNATKKYDILKKSNLVLTLNAKVMTDLDSKLVGIFGHEDGKSFKIPAYMGRLTYKGIDNVTLVGEFGLAKAKSDAKFESNLHARAKWDFAPGGSLELGYGKATLNGSDNAVANRATAKGYYTLKFGFSF